MPTDPRAVAGRTPGLTTLRRPSDGDVLGGLRRIWAAGDAVLPLPDDDAEAARLTKAMWADDPPPLPAGTALVVATSGSTGTPRGVVLSHAALDAAVRMGNARLGVTADDRWLCCLPLHHIAGLLTVLRGTACATPTIVHRGFDVGAVAAALDAPRPPTVVSLVPTMLHRLLAAGVAVDRFRCILLGGAAADPGLLRRAHAAGAVVVTSYGMTEMCGGVVYDGRPLDGTAVALAADGGILLAGPTRSSGDRNDPDGALTADGAPDPTCWLATADLGRWDDAGRLEVVGRRDDVIVTGAENVSATMVERALRADPAVSEAAVVGVADREWGQRIEAWVVPVTVPSAAADVMAGVRSRLPAHAVPKRLHMVAELPRTALGKVARDGLAGTPVLDRWPQDAA